MSNGSYFPFSAVTAFEPDVVDWITAVIYPREFAFGGDIKSGVKKRVRSRIRYAREKNALVPRSTNGHVEVEPFFSWASRQRGWETLVPTTGIQGVNVNMNKLPPVPAAVGAVGALIGTDVPHAPAALKSKLIDGERKIADVEAERDRYKNELDTRRERSRNAAKYGKQGGRGRSK